MLKRWLGLLMACCMLFTLAQPIAWADENPSFVVSAESADVSGGDAEVTVTVSMENNPGVDRVSFKVNYPAELELVEKPAASEILPALNFRSDLESPYPINMGNNTAEEEVAPAGVNGVILTLKFKVKAGTAAGTYPVELTDQVGRAHDLSKVTFNAVNGGVTVENPVPAEKVKVTFDANGGAFSDGATSKDVELDKGASLTQHPENPAQAGYDFIGWYVDKEHKTEFSISQTIDADTVIYAGWEKPVAEKVTVTFDANGGAFGDGATSKDVELDKGATVTAPTDNPTRDGYDFIGWFASADAQNVFDFDAGINADATVYAGWKEIPVEQVSVTFDANGGAFGYGSTTTVVQIDKGATVTAPTENPTRDGYSFAGWFTTPDALIAFDFSKAVDANTTVYASWSVTPAEKVTVTFDANGGTPATTQVEIDKGAKVTAPAENPTRDNYDFNGWFSDPDAKTAFDFSAAIAADTTVYAGWKETEVLIEYVNVTFNANGGAFGDGATAVVVIDKGQLVTAPAENPTRNGYNFNGWFTAADAKTPFDFSKAIDADTVVYAGWEEVPAEKVKVTFDGNGGLPEKTEREIDKGATVTAPANPTRSGYEFTGWFSEKAATTEFDFTKAVDANTTVYAGWSKKDDPAPTPSGDGCYIATSVYGSYDCPEVWTLRRFRDDVLGSTWYGRLFIKAYYATSPTLVKWFGDADWFRNFWRDRLDDMVQGLQDDGFESTPYQDQDWRA